MAHAACEFVLPDRAAVEKAAEGADSYSVYNYYGRGPIAWAKRARFVRALKLADSTPAERVIDMGCADGLFLPTLARRYRHVQGIDVSVRLTPRAQRLVETLELSNVSVLCARGVGADEVRRTIGSGYRLMFLLETLEHVGRQPDLWESKMVFLRECFSLLEPEGRIVISVPKMVGLVMLFKHLLQRALRLKHDPLTMRQVLRSALLKDTDALEALWRGNHVGFNHLKLDRHLAREFVIHRRVETAISVFYLLGRQDESTAQACSASK